jgi:streptogramin lyase
MRRWMRASSVLVCLAAVGMPAGSGSATGSVRAPIARRTAGPTLGEQILVDLRPGAPRALATGADGSLFVADVGTARVYERAADGRVVVLPVKGLHQPTALAVGSDGTVYVGDGDRVVRWRSDGSQDEFPVPGVQDIGAIALGPGGDLYVTDPSAVRVLHLSGGGQTDVGFTGLGAVRGLDVTSDGTVYVVDPTQHDVVSRTSGGTQSLLGFTGLVAPVAVDVEGDHVYVADQGQVVQQVSGGATTKITSIDVPSDVTAMSDGTVYATSDDDGLCHCPSPPGFVRRWTAAQGDQTVDLGDVAAVASFDDTPDGTIVFTSYQGAPAYSDLNPLRRLGSDGSVTDVHTAPATTPSGVVSDPHGPLYVTSGFGDQEKLFTLAADGTVTEVPLPKGEGLLRSVTVDGHGAVAISMSFGEPGPATIHIRRPGAAEVVSKMTPEQALVSIAGAPDGFEVVSYDGGHDRSPVSIDHLAADGTTSHIEDLTDTFVEGFTVDAAGNRYLFVRPMTNGSIPTLRVEKAGGGVDTPGLPADVGFGPIVVAANGAILTRNANGQLVELTGYRLPQTVATPGPASPPPATPVPSSGSFTG